MCSSSRRWLALSRRSRQPGPPLPSHFPGRSWENADPAKTGWSLPKLEAAREYAAKIGSSAVMVVQDGRVIAAWDDVQRNMEIHSMRKGFMSALYGIAVSKKQIDLDKTLGELGIDDKPPSLRGNTARHRQWRGRIRERRDDGGASGAGSLWAGQAVIRVAVAPNANRRSASGRLRRVDTTASASGRPQKAAVLLLRRSAPGASGRMQTSGQAVPSLGALR
jgi:hypothetical protein